MQKKIFIGYNWLPISFEEKNGSVAEMHSSDRFVLAFNAYPSQPECYPKYNILNINIGGAAKNMKLL